MRYQQSRCLVNLCFIESRARSSLATTERVPNSRGVLVGGRDFEGTRLWAERIVRQAPVASLTVFPEADHFPMLSTPQQFERFLREALR